MKAFIYHKAHSLADFQLVEQEIPNPAIGDMDLLVRIKAISFNPADTKVRQSRSADDAEGVILGWDAAGIVEDIGPSVTGFKKGDEVYYAGDITRPGSYAELQAVDYRIVAHKPKNLNFDQAAAMPLTALTAQEALFERGIEYTSDTKVLIIGGAGGVGSMAIQLLKTLTPATVIATATRPETVEWVRKMGADHVIGRDLEVELKEAGLVDVVFSTTHTDSYLSIIPNILRPFGHLVLIDDPKSLDIVAYKSKALSVHWEFMFAKSMHTYKPEQQGTFLKKLASLIEDQKITNTLQKTFPLSADSIKEAHTLLESGKAIGKIGMSS